MWSNQQFSGDWALNPSAYKNVSHEDVDWASLAQQWIKMKEATTALITPPPPPTASNATVDKNDEKGEAPMDMETDDKSESTADPSTWGNWPNWQQNWGWNWSGDNNSEQGSSSKEPYGYTSTFTPTENSATIDYNHGAGPANQPVYWTGQAAGAPDVSSQKDSKPYIRSSRYTWRRSERDRDRDKDRAKERDSKEDDPGDEDSADTLDAAKRKQLPLWIREGLEKMEREKQRKIDKEKADKERDEYLKRKKADDEAALSKMDSVEAAKFMARSKFDSDGSDGEPEKIAMVRHRKSRFHEEERPNSTPYNSEIKKEKSKTPPPMLPEPVKTKEELLEDLMMNVRRTLTEILLDVTTEEIETISRQVYQKARSKAPAKRLRKSQAFASIAGKSGLGLGIYGSDDDTDSDDSNSSIRKSARNSDDELDEVIRQKKEIFAKTEEEIEAQLEAEEARERMARESVNSSEDESDAGVGQVEHISHVHDVKKEVPRIRGTDDGGKRRKKISESLTETNSEIRDNSITNEKRNKKNDLSSDGSSSNVSNISLKRKSFKRKRKKSSGSSDEKSNKKKSETSDEESERFKRKTKKKRGNDSSDESGSVDENETEKEDYKRKNKSHDHEKRHKKSKKSDKDGKRDSDKAKKSSRRSLSKGSEGHRRNRRRSKSQDTDRRARRRSRSRDNDHRRRHSRSREEYRRRRSRSYDSGSRRGRSRTRELDHRRNRSRSKDSYRRQRSKSRESNNRRKRSRSKDVDRKHGRRRGSS